MQVHHLVTILLISSLLSSTYASSSKNGRNKIRKKILASKARRQGKTINHETFHEIRVEPEDLKLITINGSYHKNESEQNGGEPKIKKAQILVKETFADEHPTSDASINPSLHPKNTSVVLSSDISNKAPFKNLPDSYKNILPTSYHATHTYVKPIESIFDEAENSTDKKTRQHDITGPVLKMQSEAVKIPELKNEAEFLLELNDEDLYDSDSSEILSNEPDNWSGQKEMSLEDNISLLPPEQLKYDDSLALEADPSVRIRSHAELRSFRPRPDVIPSKSPESFLNKVESGKDSKSDFLPSKHAPPFLQPSRLTFLQQPGSLPPVPSVPTMTNFGVSLTPIVVDQDGFKEGEFVEVSFRNEKLKTQLKQPNKLQPIGQNFQGEVGGNSFIRDSSAEVVDPSLRYKNQWTASGKKKPLVDPSVKAAEYHDRQKVSTKDQHALESHFDDGYNTFEYFSDDDFGSTFHGYERPTTFIEGSSIPSHPLKVTVKDGHEVFDEDSPEKNALLFLSSHGPKVPVVWKLMDDFKTVMTSVSQNLHDPLVSMRQTAVHSGEPMFEKMGHTIGKMFGGHFGDGTFDAFDFIPLVAIVVGASLLLAGLFPSGLASLTGINNGTVVIGRKESRKGQKTSMLDDAIDRLETGILMISAMRYNDGCDAKLACSLGAIAKESKYFTNMENKHFVFGVINQMLPETFSGFSRKFEDVLMESDLSSCKRECSRCLTL